MVRSKAMNTSWTISTPSTHRLLRSTAALNDFADYVNGSALTQWSFVVPNVGNDGYDTPIDHTAQCLQHQLFP